MRYTIYGLVDREGSLDIRYVGCTTMPLRYKLSAHRNNTRGDSARAIWVRKLHSEGKTLHIVPLATVLGDWDVARLAEKEVIDQWEKYSGGRLVNTQWMRHSNGQRKKQVAEWEREFLSIAKSAIEYCASLGMIDIPDTPESWARFLYRRDTEQGQLLRANFAKQRANA